MALAGKTLTDITMLTLEIKTGYVYVLKSTLLGGYKIGITTSPASRFKALAVGSKAELVGYWSVDAYRELEKQLHKEYGAKRVPQSEWFDLTEEELLEVISKISSLGFPEYIEPETAKIIEYKPHYKVVKTLPYEQNKYAHVNYYGAWALALLTGLLLGMQF